ncbi:alpha/beta hydrolase [Paraflavitalea pollutisoli]|uniref:alpha/beta hydrolase n=1 Tax=Paraflavitalea pollutisoli TaxID=3034143 RepID=UPI0023EB0F4C|nr:alpha/beta fold hydrolase [Paraflavitalea sp. H1-2-19X]
MKLCLSLLGISLWYAGMTQPVTAQQAAPVETSVTLKTESGNIAGWLSLPASGNSETVALIIAGSGPTDKDGNNQMMKNNSLKMLSDELLKQGITTLRYDKRGIGASVGAMKAESALRFDDYVSDARGWVALLQQDKRFRRVVVIGHSEGSLIGMLAAADAKANAYISIAGAGQRADALLKEQFNAQPPMVRDLALPILDSLGKGKTVDSVNRMINSVFRPSIQPYMISWFRYDPQVLIAKLRMPVLIVQGDQDIQVSVEDAKRLSAANPRATLAIIPGMNHILKPVSGDRAANMKTYNDPLLPIVPALGQQVVSFIKGKK